ncbi:MAG: Wzz/FepE/Etk N-terminal domain-containing protein [Bellilinea sp.]
MDDVIDIDLRKIITDLLTGWKWIAAFTLLAGIAVFLFSYLQPRFYSATTLVAITPPRYLPSFENQNARVIATSPTNKAIVDLALSDDVVRDVFQAWKSSTQASGTLGQFRQDYLEAAVGGDPAIVVLRVRAESPDLAFKLANDWAQATVASANRLFYDTDAGLTTGFEAQITRIEQELQAAEQALSDFESRDQISILNNELTSLLAQQADWLSKQRLIENSIRDAAGFIAQVDGLGEDTAVPASMQTNFMVLQLKVYNNPSPSQAGASPLQIQLPATSGLQPLAKADFVTLVQGWIDNLNAQSEEIQASIDQLSGQITALQQQIQDQKNEKAQLTLDYEKFQETYAALIQKNEEVKISSSDLYASIQIASSASLPEKSDARNTVRNTAIALVMGFILSLGFVLVLNWWRPQKQI